MPLQIIYASHALVTKFAADTCHYSMSIINVDVQTVFRYKLQLASAAIYGEQFLSYLKREVLFFILVILELMAPQAIWLCKQLVTQFAF